MILDSVKEYNEVSERMKCEYVKNCKKCNGEGILKSNLGYVECTCMKKSKIIAREICNGVPERLIDKKLVNVNNKTVAKFLQDYIDNLQSNIDSLTNLLVIGDNKLNIVEILSIFINSISFKKNNKGYFYNSVMCDLNDLMQSSYLTKSSTEYKNIYNKIIDGSDLLIINYVGSETDTRNDLTARFLSNIITRRAINGKLTFLSSTLKVDELNNKYGNELSSLFNSNYKILNLNKESNIGKETNTNGRGYY